MRLVPCMACNRTVSRTLLSSRCNGGLTGPRKLPSSHPRFKQSCWPPTAWGIAKREPRPGRAMARALRSRRASQGILLRLSPPPLVRGEVREPRGDTPPLQSPASLSRKAHFQTRTVSPGPAERAAPRRSTSAYICEGGRGLRQRVPTRRRRSLVLRLTPGELRPPTPKRLHVGANAAR